MFFRLTISDNTSEVFCCEFSADGMFLAAGCGDGAIRVFNAQVRHISFVLPLPHSPLSSIQFISVSLSPTHSVSVSLSHIHTLTLSPSHTHTHTHLSLSHQNGLMSYNLQGGSNVALPTTAINFRPSDGKPNICSIISLPLQSYSLTRFAIKKNE